MFRKYFVLFLTFMAVCSCHTSFTPSRIEGKKIPITATQESDPTIEKVIQPYRDHIEKELSEVLAYNPETLDKSKGKWQTNIGNFIADVTLERTNRVLKLRNAALAQVCILNHGGIRSILPKGNVTARSAYEVMPFENSVVVIALKGSQLVEMANYIVAEKKPHPISGLTFTIRDNEATQIKIQGQPVDEKMTYFVATSDYLSNGGDNMSFFKKGLETIVIDYKIRNLLIDYFKETDTIRVNNSIRITQD
ncbi:MAG: hypothetical protein RLZZ500_259 [Bacteroidota bacterium]